MSVKAKRAARRESFSPRAACRHFLPCCKFWIFFLASSLAAFRRSALYGVFSLKLNRPFLISNVRHPFSSSSTNRHSDGYFLEYSFKRFLRQGILYQCLHLGGKYAPSQENPAGQNTIPVCSEYPDTSEFQDIRKHADYM